MPSHPAYTMLWHLTVHYELHGQQCQNGFYFSNRISVPFEGETVPNYAQVVHNQFYGFVFPDMKAFQNQQVHYKGIIVQTLIPNNGSVWEFTIESETGLQANESLPSYCAAILSLRTGFGGKSNRGRLYIAGVGEDDHAAGKLLPDSFTQLNDFGNQLLAVFGPTGGSGYIGHVVFSKKQGYIDNTYFTGAVRQITHYVPRLLLGTQRHRLIGFGT